MENNGILKEVVNEMFGKKLYHCVSPKNMSLEDAMKSVLTEGLKVNDNGERGEGIWFSDEPFYGDRAVFVVSIEANKDNIERFDIIDSEYNIAFAKKNIPAQYLTIEKIPFICFNGKYSCFSPFYAKTYGVGGKKDFIEMLNQNAYPNIVVFKDILEKYTSSDFVRTIDWNRLTNPNVSVANLLN